MHRLFVALRPPPDMRRLLLSGMGGGAGVRWQRDDQLHLTLRFIGEVDRHRAADVAAALGGVHAAPIAFALQGAGLFDRRGVPDTLWAGVTPRAPLRQLHDRIGAALARIGIGAACLPASCHDRPAVPRRRAARQAGRALVAPCLRPDDGRSLRIVRKHARRGRRRL